MPRAVWTSPMTPSGDAAQRPFQIRRTFPRGGSGRGRRTAPHNGCCRDQASTIRLPRLPSFPPFVDEPPGEPGLVRLNAPDLVHGALEEIAIDHDEVREFARFERSFVLLREGDVRVVCRVQP